MQSSNQAEIFAQSFKSYKPAIYGYCFGRESDAVEFADSIDGFVMDYSTSHINSSEVIDSGFQVLLF